MKELAFLYSSPSGQWAPGPPGRRRNTVTLILAGVPADAVGDESSDSYATTARGSRARCVTSADSVNDSAIGTKPRRSYSFDLCSIGSRSAAAPPPRVVHATRRSSKLCPDEKLLSTEEAFWTLDELSVLYGGDF